MPTSAVSIWKRHSPAKLMRSPVFVVQALINRTDIVKKNNCFMFVFMILIVFISVVLSVLGVNSYPQHCREVASLDGTMPQWCGGLSPPDETMPQQCRGLSPPGETMSQQCGGLSPPNETMPQQCGTLSPLG
jgi:hypothetical protein